MRYAVIIFFSLSLPATCKPALALRDLLGVSLYTKPGNHALQIVYFENKGSDTQADDTYDGQHADFVLNTSGDIHLGKHLLKESVLQNPVRVMFESDFQNSKKQPSAKFIQSLTQLFAAILQDGGAKVGYNDMRIPEIERYSDTAYTNNPGGHFAYSAYRSELMHITKAFFLRDYDCVRQLVVYEEDENEQKIANRITRLALCLPHQ